MKTKITVIAVAALLTLTGCATGTDNQEKLGSLGASSFYQDLPDGTQVICVRLYSDSITCDFAHKIVDIGEDK